MSNILTKKDEDDIQNAIGGKLKDNFAIIYLEDYTPEDILRKWNLAEFELSARGYVKPGRPITSGADPGCDTRVYAFVECSIERYAASDKRFKGMPIRDMARHWIDESCKPASFCATPSEDIGFDRALRYLGMTRERFINRCMAGFIDFLSKEMKTKETL